MMEPIKEKIFCSNDLVILIKERWCSVCEPRGGFDENDAKFLGHRAGSAVTLQVSFM
jgi:hypothetical protein